MKYEVDNNLYEVEIIRKNNKNTYIRIKNNKICVTTSYFATNSYVKKILDNNYNFLTKALEKEKLKQEKENNFYYLGKLYNIIIVPSMDIDISDNIIFVKSYDYLNKWLKRQISIIFKERLDYWYNIFEEDIPVPNLKIRKMTTRWGVCNRKNNNITLNSELIKYGIEQIDYVIIHELSHFVHFDHSKYFWATVEKYCKDYKKQRKILKDN
jgi:hypothetical protein